MSAVPGKHASQVVWPALETDPTSHGLQGVAGLESWSAKPARQSAHVVAVALAPGWQVAHAVAELESSSYVLPEHGTHVVAPASVRVSVWLPGPQARHVVAMSLS